MGYRDSNQAVPDPGRGTVKREPFIFRCQSCAWTVRDHGLATVGETFRAAQQHRADGHIVTWRGRPVQFE